MAPHRPSLLGHFSATRLSALSKTPRRGGSAPLNEAKCAGSVSDTTLSYTDRNRPLLTNSDDPSTWFRERRCAEDKDHQRAVAGSGKLYEDRQFRKLVLGKEKDFDALLSSLGRL
jgi:hypothetical protein